VALAVANLHILLRYLGLKIASGEVAAIKAFIIKTFVARKFAYCRLIA
jgi:hypothetical protein